MQRGYRPPDVFSAQDKRESLFYGGIWLIFLLWPVAAIAASDDSLLWKILGWASIAAFVAIYMYGLTHPRPFSSRPRWMATLCYTVVLLSLMVPVALTAGVGALNLCPYVLALWLFSHRWRAGLAGAGLVLLVSLAVGLIFFPNEVLFYLVVPLGTAFVVLLMVRFMVEKDENDRAISKQLALSQQREELARTVHDVLGHSLTAVSVSAQLARRLVYADPQAAAAQLDNILATARTALSEVRSTVVELRQPDLAEQLRVARTLLDAAGIAADLPKARGLDALGEAERELFAWCLREGITNVVRHSGASRCRVRISETWLRIDDDGVGLSKPAGHGLAGLRQRVEEAGGTLSIGVLPAGEQAGSQQPGTRMEVAL